MKATAFQAPAVSTISFNEKLALCGCGCAVAESWTEHEKIKASDETN